MVLTSKFLNCAMTSRCFRPIPPIDTSDSLVRVSWDLDSMASRPVSRLDTASRPLEAFTDTFEFGGIFGKVVSCFYVLMKSS